MAFQIIVNRALDDSGDPISGAKAYFYESGTTDLLTVYTDTGLGTAHPSPLVADSAGRFAQVFYVGSPEVKIVVQDASDVTVETIDPAPVVAATTDTANLAPLTTNSGASDTLVKNDSDTVQRYTSTATVTLPSASGLDNGWRVSILADGGDVTVSRAGSDTIDGGTSITVADGDSADVVCDGSAFYSLPGTASVAVSDLNSGTNASASTFWRGDGTWSNKFAATVFPEQGSAPTTAANEMAVYAKETASRSGLFAREESDGDELRVPLLERAASISTTSGTAHDLTGIPTDVTYIRAVLNGVTLSASDELMLQLGDSGGFETSGYSGGLAAVAASNTPFYAASTSGFLISGQSGTPLIYGVVELFRRTATSDVWALQGALWVDRSGSSNDFTNFSAGIKGLSAALDRLRFRSQDGSTTFTAGTIDIAYSAGG